MVLRSGTPRRRSLSLSMLFIPLTAWASPSPEALLRQILAQPTVAYQGRLSITQWAGRTARSEDVEVYYDPTQGSRWEFLSIENKPERIAVSNDREEQLYLIRQKKVLTGRSFQGSPKPITEEKEVEYVLKNYRVSVDKADRVAGRSVWVLVLTPWTEGKSYQKILVDQETHIILETKKYLLNGRMASRTRFIEFQPKQGFSPETFQIQVSSEVTVDTHGLDPDFLSLAAYTQAVGRGVAVVETLPGGFVFESGDLFDLEGQPVQHVSYTDGVSLLSLFITPKPVRVPLDPFVESTSQWRRGIPRLGLSGSGRVLQWRQGARYYILIGDVSQALLREMSEHFKRH